VGKPLFANPTAAVGNHGIIYMKFLKIPWYDLKLRELRHDIPNDLNGDFLPQGRSRSRPFVREEFPAGLFKHRARNEKSAFQPIGKHDVI
jgi:hypothetical protein